MEEQTAIVKKPFNIGQSKITAGFLADICGFFAGYNVIRFFDLRFLLGLFLRKAGCAALSGGGKGY